MADIYFSSTLTIAASDAKDSTRGFFARPSAINSEETIAQSRAFFIVKGSDCSSNLLVYVESRAGLAIIPEASIWYRYRIVLLRYY
jgi:hypothetical protein